MAQVEDHVTGNGVIVRSRWWLRGTPAKGRLEHGAAAGAGDVGQVVDVLVVKDEVLQPSSGILGPIIKKRQPRSSLPAGSPRMKALNVAWCVHSV